MTLVLTEKPTQARALASIMQSAENRNGLYFGFFEGIEFLICPLSGHIYKVDEEREGIDLLNFIPPKKIMKRVPDKEGHLAQTHKKLKKVQTEYFNSKIDSMILATDPDPEGCAIAREVIEDYGFDAIGDIVYMDMSNNSKGALKKSLEKALTQKKDFLNWERYAFAAWLRSDYSFTGKAISYTLNAMLKKEGYNSFYTFGTQQIRILDLVVSRYLENKNADRSDRYRIKIHTPKGTFRLETEEIAEIDNKNRDEVERIASKITQEGRVTIQKAEGVTGYKKSPKWYDGSHIGAKVAKETGKTVAEIYSNKKSIMQTMYESGLITYIRGEAKGKMPMVDLETYKEIARHLSKFYNAPKLDTSLVKPYLWRKDDSKETVNHTPCTIADTYNVEKYAGVEKSVIDTAAKQILATFYPDEKVRKYNIVGKSGGYNVVLEDEETLDLGWKEIYGIKPSKLNNERIREISEGEEIKIDEVEIEKYTVSPPPLFTEASLMDAIKKKGIGSDSTFGTMIDFILDRQKGSDGKVIKRGYCRFDEKKRIIPTEKGIMFASAFPKETKESIKAFESGVFKLLLKNEIDEAKGLEYKNKLSMMLYTNTVSTFKEKLSVFGQFGKKKYEKKPDPVKTGIKCPLCKEGDILDTGSVYQCSLGKSVKNDKGEWEHTGCKFKLFKYSKKGYIYTIDHDVLKTLVEESIAKSVRICGEKSGKQIENARLKITDDYTKVEVVTL